MKLSKVYIGKQKKKVGSGQGHTHRQGRQIWTMTNISMFEVLPKKSGEKTNDLEVEVKNA